MLGEWSLDWQKILQMPSSDRAHLTKLVRETKHPLKFILVSKRTPLRIIDVLLLTSDISPRRIYFSRRIGVDSNPCHAGGIANESIQTRTSGPCEDSLFKRSPS